MISDAANLIIDVGMHNGDDTAYYLHEGFNVLAIEANPQLCEKGARRFRQAISQGRLTILNCAIHKRKGQLPFFINEEHTEWSSFDKSIACRDGKQWPARLVTCISFSE